jgi:hypothetical protein
MNKSQTKGILMEINHDTIENQLAHCIASFDIKADQQVLSDLRKALIYKAEGRSPDSVKNTYLQDLEIPQIVLFDILANRFPLVINAQKIISNAILSIVDDKHHITIADLGIGRGLQITRILKKLNEIKTIKTVTVIGVEIFKSALDHTTALIPDLKKELHYQLEYHPMNILVEHLDAALLSELIPSNNQCLLINASLTLHHIQSEANRLMLFQKLKSLNPSLVTLVEPNTNCFTNNFDERLLNVYEHFCALYGFINTLQLLPEEKKGLKQFFSTELFDAVALPEDHRFEKYNTSEAWLKTASEAGFTPYDLSESAKDINIKDIEVQVKSPGYVNFQFHHANILGTIAVN